MERDTSLSAEHREHLGIILRSGEHLLGLIEDVLSLSKIEAGMLTLSDEPFDLRRLLEGTEETFRERARDKNLDLTFDVASGVPNHVRGDEGRLRQVLFNLLGNAIKFTREGRVDLRLEWHDGRASFEVEDTGPGISPVELETIFEPFVQTEIGREAREGSGLGLAISRNLVRKMDGELRVESEVGRGTRFSFEVELPRAATMPALVPRRVVGLEPGQAPVRVLVADDAEENRLLLSRLMSSVGIEVRAAADGAAALEVWRDWQPHLIWMDMRMPGVDGYEATRRIRETGDDRTVIVSLTATAFEHDRDMVLAAGCDDFMTKPFREAAIFDKLSEHLGVRFTYREETEGTAGSSPGPGGGSAGGGEAEINILIVEDNSVNCELILKMLTSLGCRADVANDGREAVVACESRTYDLVLMDVEMPTMDGIEATREIRARASGDGPPIVAMTAHGPGIEHTRCREAGMNEILTKPVRLEALAELVERVFRNTEGATLDREILASLHALDSEDGGGGFLAEVIGAFFTNSSGQLEELRQTVAEGDSEQVARIAHSLKGSSKSLGAMELGSTCNALELAARNGDATAMETCLAELVVELGRAHAALELELERSRGHAQG